MTLMQFPARTIIARANGSAHVVIFEKGSIVIPGIHASRRSSRARFGQNAPSDSGFPVRKNTYIYRGQELGRAAFVVSAQSGKSRQAGPVLVPAPDGVSGGALARMCVV